MSEKQAYPSDQADKVLVRMPDGMRDRLKDAAKANNRTMNAEIVARLDRSFTADKEVEQIAFESGFEASMLREDVARLNALLQKASETKASQAPNADEIADKVAAKLFTRADFSRAHEKAHAYFHLLSLAAGGENPEESIDAETIAAIDKWIDHRKSSISGRSTYGPQGSLNAKSSKK